VYKQGRRALHEARDRPDPDSFHEWRKQVKHLRYALETLSPLWPEMIDEVADQAHELSDYLGEEHDLTLLAQISVAKKDSLQNSTLSALMALIDQYRGELRQKALSLGLRLYEERPKAFAERFAHYWAEWAHENKRKNSASV
jgi:CHAD domain-containing protein